MKEQLRLLLAQEHITEFGVIPIDLVNVINPRLMPSDVKSAVILAVPYDTCHKYTDGISAYAHVRDYHLFFEELFKRLICKLQGFFPGESFYGFADHSPIAEKDAAAKAGLGVLGCNSLLINPIYGSYVFLASLLTSFEIQYNVFEVKKCNACNRCLDACPGHAISDNVIEPTRCLSAISQKKKLSEQELEILREKYIAWGCDICQTVCPCNEKRMPTPIPYFINYRHDNFDAKEVESMSHEEFLQHPFSWRGKNRILGNLQNLVDE